MYGKNYPLFITMLMYYMYLIVTVQFYLDRYILYIALRNMGQNCVEHSIILYYIILCGLDLYMEDHVLFFFLRNSVVKF